MIHIIKKHNQKKTTIMILLLLISIAFLPITNATIETQNAETNTPKTITKMDETIHIEFTRPISNSFYFRNQRLFPIQNNIISYGPIELEAYATAENNITYVEFYDDNTLIYTDYTAPYTYIWNPIRCLQHTIKVTAYDTQKNAISDELTITKWRSHPLLIVTATALALYIGAYVFNGDPLLGWTAIRGYVVNIKKEGNDLVFRAIRLHYTEVTPREVSTGVLKFQKIRISDIGPDRRIYLGPFGTYVYITGICHGGIQEI